MIIVVDVGSDVPIYQQLRDRVVEAIAAGTARQGDPLPSTRALAADLAINMHTVAKAYDLLRREGLVQLTRRSGAVVARDRDSGPPEPGFVADWQARTRVLLAEALSHGVDPDTVLAHCSRLLHQGVES